MIRRVITARDGEKTLSVEYSPFSKEWRITKREGKSLCVIPAHKSFIKVEDYTEKREKLNKLKEYVKERFEGSRYSIKFLDKKVYLALCKDCFECENIELEPFALARLFSLYDQKGFVIDWGKNKTLFVEVEDGLLKSFRVVLRGGDYITQGIQEAKSIDFSQGESLKKTHGMELSEVKERVEEIIHMSGYDFGDKRVLLTGGGSRLKGLREIFPNTILLQHCEPEYGVALGACLREVLKNPYPDFTQEELSPKDIKVLAYKSFGLLSLFLLSFFIMQKTYSVERLREIQRIEFRKVFPNEPIISIRDQVRAKVSTGEEYELSKLLIKAQENLKVGMKLYSFEWDKGRLVIKGEAERSILEGLPVKSAKETATGKVEFQLELP